MTYQERIEAEEQRAGRNKETTINHTYINGGEYRKKFDLISENKELNRLLFQLAKKMLEHRNGTEYEDMYWIDTDQCEVVAKELDSIIKHKIIYSDATNGIVNDYKKTSDKSLITIHSHPSSFPPSIDDLIANYENDYSLGIIVCHNGSIYIYAVDEELNADYYKLVLADYFNAGYNECEAQIMAIKEMASKFEIMFKEVTTL